MRQLRLLGVTCLAVFALGAAVAATASATEPGWLLLAALEKPIEVTTTSAVTKFKTAAGTLTCQKLSTLKFTFGEKGSTHVTLSLDTDLHFTECKSEANGCRSENAKGEKDPPETILMLVDAHLVNLLNGEKLEPGIALRILNSALEVGPIKLTCGVLKIELKGAPKGLVINVSLTEDVTKGTVDFSETFDKCDSNDKECLAIEEKEPFLAKFKTEFQSCTLEAETPFTLNQMVLVDD
jgi:hypothetical protein